MSSKVAYSLLKAYLKASCFLRTISSASPSEQQMAQNNTYYIFRGNVFLQTQLNTQPLLEIYDGVFFFLLLLLFVHSMASKSYETGFKKYYGNRLDNISNKTTEEEIKRIYDDWAGEYEEVIRIHGTLPVDPWSRGCDVFQVEYHIVPISAATGSSEGDMVFISIK